MKYIGKAIALFLCAGILAPQVSSAASYRPGPFQKAYNDVVHTRLPYVRDGVMNTRDNMSYQAGKAGRFIKTRYRNGQDAIALKARQGKRSFLAGYRNVKNKSPEFVSTYRNTKASTLNKLDGLGYKTGKGYRSVRDGAVNTVEKGKLFARKTGRSIRTGAKTKAYKVSSRPGKGYAGRVGGYVLGSALITTGLMVADNVYHGGTVSEGLDSAFSYMSSPVFYIGDLLGGITGATLGSMIPLPAVAASGSLLGGMIGRLPVLGGAMLFASLGSAAVTLHKEGRLTLSNLFRAIDFPVMSGQILGATIGAGLASFLLPLPGLSSVLGGIAGGMIGARIARWITGESKSIFQGTFNNKVSLTSSAGAAVTRLKNKFRPDPTTRLEDLRQAMDEAYKRFQTTPKGPAQRQAFEDYVDAKNAYDAMCNSMAIPLNAR